MYESLVRSFSVAKWQFHANALYLGDEDETSWKAKQDYFPFSNWANNIVVKSGITSTCLGAVPY